MRLNLREFAGYFAVSAAALAIDVALLFALTTAGGVEYLIASAISYGLAELVHYGLATRFVFRHRRVARRWLEFVSYVTFGFAGLLATLAVLAVVVGRFEAPLLVGKTVAVGVSFLLNFALRRLVLFTRFEPPR